MVRNLRCALLLVLFAAGVTFAQAPAAAPAGASAWQGKSKMGGKVIDEAGKIVPGVTVKFAFSSGGGPADVVTNAKGEWKIENISDGVWTLEFWKDGFDPRRVPVQVGGKVKEPNIELKMTKEGTDPSFAVPYTNDKAKVLMDQKKFAEAREIYQKLLVAYPNYHRIHLAIAQCLDSEGNFEAAAAAIQKYVTANPTEISIRTFLAIEYIKAKKYDEAWKLYAAADLQQITDPVDINDPGVSLLKTSKPDEAFKYFNLAVTRFPQDALGYFYRGLSENQIAATLDKTKTAEVRAQMTAAKTDLQKFLELAGPTPTGPAQQFAGTAKQLVEAIDKALGPAK